jgi:hypothetical protein
MGCLSAALELGAGANSGARFLQSPAIWAMADDGGSGGGKGKWEEGSVDAIWAMVVGVGI